MLVDCLGTVITFIGLIFLASIGLFFSSMIKDYINFIDTKKDIF